MKRPDPDPGTIMAILAILAAVAIFLPLVGTLVALAVKP